MRAARRAWWILTGPRPPPFDPGPEVDRARGEAAGARPGRGGPGSGHRPALRPGPGTRPRYPARCAAPKQQLCPVVWRKAPAPTTAAQGSPGERPRGAEGAAGALRWLSGPQHTPPLTAEAAAWGRVWGHVCPRAGRLRPEHVVPCSVCSGTHEKRASWPLAVCLVPWAGECSGAVPARDPSCCPA